MSISSQNTVSFNERVDMWGIPCLLHSVAEEPDLLTIVSPMHRGSSTDISSTEGNSSSARGIVLEETAGNGLGAAGAIRIPRHL